MASQAAKRQLQDDDSAAAAASRQLIAEREAELEDLRAQLVAADGEQNLPCYISVNSSSCLVMICHHRSGPSSTQEELSIHGLLSQ